MGNTAMEKIDATVKEAASFLRCSERTIYRRIRAGSMTYLRYSPAGPIFIPWDALRKVRQEAMKSTT